MQNLDGSTRRGAPESSSTLPTTSPWVSAFRFRHNPQRIRNSANIFCFIKLYQRLSETILLFCTNKLSNHRHRHLAILNRIVDGQSLVLQSTLQGYSVVLLCTFHGNSTSIIFLSECISTIGTETFTAGTTRAGRAIMPSPQAGKVILTVASSTASIFIVT